MSSSLFNEHKNKQDFFHKLQNVSSWKVQAPYSNKDSQQVTQAHIQTASEDLQGGYSTGSLDSLCQWLLSDSMSFINSEIILSTILSVPKV